MRLVLASLVVLGCSSPATPPPQPPAEPAPAAAQQAPPAPAPDAAPVPRATPVTAAELESSAKPRGRHPAHTSQAELAAQLNEEGKRAVLAGEYATASSKFREAVARVPEPIYFFNLCVALFQEGRFAEALTACAAVESNNPTPAVLDKSKRMMDRIRDEAKRQHIEVGS